MEAEVPDSRVVQGSMSMISTRGTGICGYVACLGGLALSFLIMNGPLAVFWPRLSVRLLRNFLHESGCGDPWIIWACVGWG